MYIDYEKKVIILGDAISFDELAMLKFLQDREVNRAAHQFTMIDKTINRIYDMVQDDANSEFFNFPAPGSSNTETAANTLEYLLRKHHNKKSRHGGSNE